MTTKYIARFFYSWDGDAANYPFDVPFEWDTATKGEPTLHENVEGVYEACLGWVPMGLCPVSDTAPIALIPDFSRSACPAAKVPCPVREFYSEDEIENEINVWEDLVIGIGYIEVA